MNKQHAVLLFSLVLCIAVRAWVWSGSNTTLEDALITFRYVENIAAGEGFVFNKGEKVMGTTSPLWTLLLSATKIIGSNNVFITGKIIGIVLDAGTLALMFSILSRISFPLYVIFASLFVSSPAIAPITVSGMETPMVLFAMTLAFAGLQRKNMLFSFGVAALILTRIDGIFFAGILAGFALFNDRAWTMRQLIIILVACLPWFIFSGFYFGGLVPQSALAKTVVYHVDISTNLQPLLVQFTSLRETGVFRFLAKSIAFLLLLAGTFAAIRKWKSLLPFVIFLAVYCTLLLCSGVLIFQWYLTPAIFASHILIAAGATWLSEKIFRTSPMRQTGFVAAMVLTICVAQTIQLTQRINALRALQNFEENVRGRIGMWLKNNAAGTTVFLEPLGYIGYHAGIDVSLMDEIGLVTPAVLPFRARGDGWYVPALQAFKPTFVVQYAYAINNNTSEGTGQKLFAAAEDKQWFDEHYREVITFDATNDYPSLADKEKKYIVFRQR